MCANERDNVRHTRIKNGHGWLSNVKYNPNQNKKRPR